MHNINKVVIIGAGSAGLSAALRLKRFNKLNVAIYELRPEPTTLGGAVGIPSNGLLLFKRLGLYDELVARGCLTPNLVLHSTRGQRLGQKSMAEYGRKQLGYSYLRIRRTDLIDVLLQALQREGIKVNFGHNLVAIKEEDEKVHVEFKNGSRDSGDFLLGCDGIHSAVRRLQVDPSVIPKYSGISNIYGLVSTEGLAASNVHDLNATLTTDGLLAVTGCSTLPVDMLYWFFSRQVPLPDEAELRDGWEHTSKREIENLKALLLGLLGDSPAAWTSYLRQLIQKTESMKFYPIYYLPIDQNWSKGRTLLLGDAAHAMPPHASQGTSMALEDVTLVSRLLADPSLSISELSQKYESIRRPRTSQLLAAARDNGAVREKVPPWRLSLNELGYSMALKAFNILNLDSYGVGQKEIAYDVEQERL